ncbi:Rap1a/Tai family immunity protein (plasmid) [Sinorhizobium kummerowiae]|uniref:Rap1a/Tai family immunity protein n=1 Tax=Sinorhizobium kummerowiae TaxID=158892 RepID=A0ABY8TIX9_9HYPH|nr:MULTISPECIES: Rap1a/Tai family immunity protein [Sinorhizobium]RVN89007.1 hypothetical protein CN105_16415 [Sinorhizobium meliloti]WHS96623.1 Rap1a/Tai family immunity protein [Sinorhizobium kummerowiae]WQH41440.1 Rap1a/Tai family immunity protein [Sinorhizobium kummerowiae]
MKTLVYTAAVTAALASPAFALSGAQLQQENRHFAMGYVQGQIEFWLSTYDDNPNVRARKSRQAVCINNGQITPDTLLDAVISYMSRNPKHLSEPAVSAVLRTLSEICGD